MRSSKAILVFDRSTPEGERDLRVALDGYLFLAALHGFSDELRRLRKYGAAEEVDPKTVEYIERLFRDEVEGLNIDR